MNDWLGPVWNSIKFAAAIMALVSALVLAFALLRYVAVVLLNVAGALLWSIRPRAHRTGRTRG